MKLDKLIYDVREGVNQYSDDSEISDRYIIYLYGIKRSKYLRQELNIQTRTFDNSILQTLCLKLEEVSTNECGVDIECETILRTTSPIPTPLELHTKVALQSVKPTNRIAVGFNFISKKRASYMEGATFNKALYSFLDPDGYIYVISGADNNHFKLLDCLTITGVFEDPLELASYSNCCGCTVVVPCFDMSTTDYPLQPHYIDLIREEIIKTLVIKLQIPEDKTNDTNN
jgi:hypothetical protein|tara:strand:+ start:2801 stop:3487 length:687 start_codon:yes stop_codon:yes gene_type:complete